MLVAILGISFAINCYYYLYKRWQKDVICSVKQAQATNSGQRVMDVINSGLEKAPGKVFWKVECYELPFLEAKVLCTVILCGGECRAFLWQWDAAWPSPRALTPDTAKTFPLLDPGVDLTPEGQSSLWKGRGAIHDYFATESTNR